MYVLYIGNNNNIIYFINLFGLIYVRLNNIYIKIDGVILKEIKFVKEFNFLFKLLDIFKKWVIWLLYLFIKFVNRINIFVVLRLLFIVDNIDIIL